jgi:hypothetical protein
MLAGPMDGGYSTPPELRYCAAHDSRLSNDVTLMIEFHREVGTIIAPTVWVKMKQRQNQIFCL